MVRPHALLIAGLLFACPAMGQPERRFQDMVAAFLAQAPMLLQYHYTLTDDDFQFDTTGVMVLVGPSVFRLELWDKIYASDGRSLYLYDRNTRQTVIDSLRWTEVNLWVRLLYGELPPETIAIRARPSRKGLVRWEMRHAEPSWFATVELDSTTWTIRDIRLQEA
ncbi:MAG: hypothetical protein ACETWG_06180, partial [Candidatus Neomarinimicrobiota bacterium]